MSFFSFAAGQGGEACLSEAIPLDSLEALPPNMFRISKDNPAYYLTSVAKDRLPVFRTDTIAKITCDAIAEARLSGGFKVFSYVIMPDHYHLVTDGRLSTAETNRYVNGIISKRVLDYLKGEAKESSLSKLRIQQRLDGWKYSLWHHHPDTRLLWNEKMLWQRIQYTHLNPVRAGLVDHPNEWLWSSSRIFNSRRAETEPLEVDLDKIKWTW